MNATESKITQKLERLDDRTRIVGRATGVIRSASSKYNDCEIMNGELFYIGAGAHAWCAGTND
jgi:hypothetical protein